MVEPFFFVQVSWSSRFLKLVFDPFVNMFSNVSEDLFHMGILKIGKTNIDKFFQL